jgi:hypothetical protein
MNEVREALSALVAKLEQIHRSPDFVGVFAMYQNHGLRYQGPNWAEELGRAKAALAKADEGPPA